MESVFILQPVNLGITGILTSAILYITGLFSKKNLAIKAGLYLVPITFLASFFLLFETDLSESSLNTMNLQISLIFIHTLFVLGGIYFQKNRHRFFKTYSKVLAVSFFYTLTTLGFTKFF